MRIRDRVRVRVSVLLDLAVWELVQLRAVGLRDVHRLVRVRVRMRGRVRIRVGVRVGVRDIYRPRDGEDRVRVLR